MMKKILRSKCCMAVMIICWLLLLWSRTFIGLANGCETSAFSVLGTSIEAIIYTVCYGAFIFLLNYGTETIYKDEEDDENDEDDYLDDYLDDYSDCYYDKQSELRTSMCVILIIALLCMFSLAMTGKLPWLDLFSDSVYMKIAWWYIDKKYLFDILILIVFPIWSTYILRKMKESNFASGAVVSGCVQILALTLIGFLLYMKLPNIWVVEMAIVNLVTLILAVRSYVWKDTYEHGNVVALLVLYGIVWIALLFTLYSKGQTFTDYMGLNSTGSPGSYLTNAKKIVENASFIGKSSVLVNDIYVSDFLEGTQYLLLNILFYAGWLPAILVMLVEVAFLVSTAGVIIKYQAHDGRDILLQTVWVGFFLRVTCGALCSFGVPIPIMLPFTGDVSLAMDSMCIGILLYNFVFDELAEVFSILEDKTFIDQVEAEFDKDDKEDKEDDDKLLDLLTENILLTVLAVGLGIAAFLFLWKYSFPICLSL